MAGLHPDFESDVLELPPVITHQVVGPPGAIVLQLERSIFSNLVIFDPIELIVGMLDDRLAIFLTDHLSH